MLSHDNLCWLLCAQGEFSVWNHESTPFTSMVHGLIQAIKGAVWKGAGWPASQPIRPPMGAEGYFLSIVEIFYLMSVIWKNVQRRLGMWVLLGISLLSPSFLLDSCFLTSCPWEILKWTKRYSVSAIQSPKGSFTPVTLHFSQKKIKLGLLLVLLFLLFPKKSFAHRQHTGPKTTWREVSLTLALLPRHLPEQPGF